MTMTPKQIIKVLTDAQKECILNLDAEYKNRGYNLITADLLVTLGDRELFGGLPALVEREFNPSLLADGRWGHRLNQAGLAVKEALILCEA